MRSIYSKPRKKKAGKKDFKLPNRFKFGPAKTWNKNWPFCVVQYSRGRDCTMRVSIPRPPHDEHSINAKCGGEKRVNEAVDRIYDGPSGLPPSLQASIQHVLAKGAFFTDSSPVVLLPPPIGLFSSLRAASSDVSMVSNIARVMELKSDVAAVSSLLEAHVSEASTSKTTQQVGKRNRNSSSEAESDDEKSQCSTASSDGSNRSREKSISNENDPAEGDTENPTKKRTWKVLLTSEQACEIYENRPRSESERSTASAASRSQQTAEKYNVNAKTIRDIWNRTTWVKATRNLWTDEELNQFITTKAAQGSLVGFDSVAGIDLLNSNEVETRRSFPILLKRPRGRPKGTKDSKPRKRKTWGNVPSWCQHRSPAAVNAGSAAVTTAASTGQLAPTKAAAMSAAAAAAASEGWCSSSEGEEEGKEGERESLLALATAAARC